ncbi:single-stranded-DNA-specific exonuclease RecJ [Bacillus cereus]|uniref:single-stranded-DNA-specific exonuclease RecJ n=1 Tax=Bacillus cereus TaxID=1396 RepID=UPI0008477CEC|nr:single-stranded-DNA-specific exonuclease RecJ [Bacillus cereus]AOM07577.1 Single-stranded-DNA-specific exonuclease RecJ [Bacillus cereus]MCC2366315.1 single-stranded-DNA-specific exonuclease RecJ [Bacillus cereus]MCC2447950.1 single-stranded-DNA-specific exonuclease RecJ [Bacillus cereus]MCC2490905.1 single-stranded-DNA-specific exonuclease RecJ [Bacillus cereus]MCU5624080.1 single-stranded-DNA-specific exonuclease RecJ [Bacillus cereus]
MHWISRIPLQHHPKYADIRYLSAQFQLHPLLTQHIYNQGFCNFEKLDALIYPKLTNMYNPFLMDEMKPAVTRTLQAIHRKESIHIFGDYDCDGITASTILYLALKELDANVTTQLPLRSEGYGLSVNTVQQLPENVSLIITVDNGSSAHDALQAAKEKGVDVIVTDHHEVLSERPDCLAFLNPKRKDNTYPFSNLCGAGVALKLVQAIYITLNRDWIKETEQFLDIVTLGTIADMMPLKDENRIFCYHGLRKMQQQPRKAFQILLDTLKIKNIDSSTIGFLIGPIFNACGRIGDPNLAASILQCTEPTTQQIKELISLNETRKTITIEHFKSAIEIIQNERLYLSPVIVVKGDFHKGIIGILASRIVNHYKKPAIVIANDGTGSARSLQSSGFSIIECITACGKYLKKFGGHTMAAGFSITPDEEQIELFRHIIQLTAMKQKISIPVNWYVGTIPIESFPLTMFHDLHALEPFGMGMPKPVFCSKNTNLCSYSVFGKEKEHIQMQIKQHVAYGFSKSAHFTNWNHDTPVDMLYTPYCYKEKNFLVQDCVII